MWFHNRFGAAKVVVQSDGQSDLTIHPGADVDVPQEHVESCMRLVADGLLRPGKRFPDLEVRADG